MKTPLSARAKSGASPAVAGQAWRDLLGPFERPGPALHLQLRKKLVDIIEAERLPVGTRLPAKRILSDYLDLSLNTVVAALRALTESGYLVGRQRSGFYVSPRPTPPEQTVRLAERAEGWIDPFLLRPSLLTFLEKPRDWRDFPFPFLYGQVDPELFPTAAWRECVRAASSVNEIRGWSLDMIDDDDPELLRQLRSRILPERGIWAAEDELLITMGAQQGLFLAAQLLLTGGRVAAIENPGYPDLKSMARLFTASVVHMSVDDQGAVPGPELLRANVIFLTCAGHCPTTAPLSQLRRRRFLDAVARTGAVIVEDDYAAGMVDGGGQAALKSMDRAGQVVHVGSLSKMLAPGLRIGYVVAPRMIITELKQLRRLVMRHPPANNLRAMSLFISLGHYRGYMARLRRSMAERHSACEDALRHHLPEVRWKRSPGSAGIWLSLPSGAQADQLAEEARRRGVLIEPGDPFFAEPGSGSGFARLGVGAIPTSRIDEGVARLAEAIRACQARGR